MNQAELLMFAATMASTAPAALAGLPARTCHEATGTAGIAALEQRWIADIDRGDRHDLASLLAGDYQDIDWQGRRRGKRVLLAAVQPNPDIHQRIRALQVRAWGDTAVATGSNRVQSRSKGWTVAVSFTDVFACIDGSWRAVSSQETLVKPATRSAKDR